jgi:hypothetical protein
MNQTNTGRKTALTALVLACVLFLTGCGLIVKDPKVDARQVIIQVNGETVDKARFTAILDNAYRRSYEEQSMYMQYGLIQEINIDREALLTSTLDSTALDVLLHQEAKKLGLDVMNKEDLARIEEEAKASYQGILDQVKEAYFPETALAGEALDAALKAKAEEFGYTLDIFKQDGEEGILHEKLRAFTGQGLTVSEEEIKAAFDTKAAEAQKAYTDDPGAYGSALTQGEPVYYTPAGYRYIKQILISPSAADEEALSALRKELEPLTTALSEKQAVVDAYEEQLKQIALGTADTAVLDAQKVNFTPEEAVKYDKLLAQTAPDAAAQAELNALKAKTPAYVLLAEAKAAAAPLEAAYQEKEDAVFAAILPKAKEVYALATAPGADFDALIALYNQDKAMPAAGYPVSEASVNFVEAFVKPAMALAAIGDISQPSRSSYGYHIMKYAADIPEGPAALGSVSEAIREELLSAKEEAAYNAAVEAWRAAADIKLYPERVLE